MNTFNKQKLEDVANTSLYTTFTNSKTIDYSFEIFSRFIKKGSVLELGPAEGLMTEKLISIDSNLTVIEGSRVFADLLSGHYPSITIVNTLFEETELKKKYDTIILGHVLEHVENPARVLNKVKEWLAPGGMVYCAVPNARSLHRQAAVEMGLLNSIFDLSEKDKHHGHLRIYTPELLQTEFIKQNFSIFVKGGYWLKPVSDSQIEASWTPEMLNAFMKLGEFYPDIAAEIYVIAKLN
jgi:2-polyprenyl-3-methyl-5-hydroxy-6-metoxy-1,4-benzoquinol methylase